MTIIIEPPTRTNSLRNVRANSRDNDKAFVKPPQHSQIPLNPTSPLVSTSSYASSNASIANDKPMIRDLGTWTPSRQQMLMTDDKKEEKAKKKKDKEKKDKDKEKKEKKDKKDKDKKDKDKKDKDKEKKDKVKKDKKDKDKDKKDKDKDKKKEKKTNIIAEIDNLQPVPVQLPPTPSPSPSPPPSLPSLPPLPPLPPSATTTIVADPVVQKIEPVPPKPPVSKENLLEVSKPRLSSNSSNAKKSKPNTLITNNTRADSHDNEDDIPWKQYASPTDAYSSTITYASDYSNIIHELDVSHAVVIASEFKPIDYAEAEKLVEKFQHLQQMVDSLYGRIRIQTDTQRATATAFKLDQPSSIAEFVNEICQSSQQTITLVDEFYFTSQSAHRTESSYLKHLAGTLAAAMQHQYPSQENFHRILTRILTKLETLFEHYNNPLQGDGSNGGKGRIDYTSSSSQSTLSLSSINSSSSSFFSGFTQSESAATSPTSASFVANANGSSDACALLHRRIDQVIEKLSRQLKHKQELLRVVDIQSASEELVVQRGRTADLAKELERHRSQRQMIAKRQESDMLQLRDQLMQETLRRQSLQDRVTSLEHTLKTKDTELNKLKNEPPTESHLPCQAQIKQLQDQVKEKDKEIERLQTAHETKDNGQHWQQKFLQAQAQFGNLEKELAQMKQDCNEAQQSLQEQKLHFEKERQRFKQEKSKWAYKEQSIVDQCRPILHLATPISCEKMVASIIAKLQQDTTPSKGDSNNNDTFLETELAQLRKDYEQVKLELKQQQEIQERKPSGDAASLQQKIAHLKQEFEKAQQTFITRESAYMLQSASTEAELERILKEYDRLTRNIVDFNSERKKLEDEILSLQKEKQELSKKATHSKISQFKESSLRKEFRELMVAVKDNHSHELVQELEKRRQLEQKLRDIKADIEMKRWEKVDVGVQTHYVHCSN